MKKISPFHLAIPVNDLDIAINFYENILGFTPGRKSHEWADYNDDYVSIGITDYAQSQLGDVIFIEFPNIGQKIVAGSIFGEVEAVKTVSDLFSPISGTVV